MAGAALSALTLYGVTTVHGHRGTLAAGTELVAFRDLAAVVGGAPDPESIGADPALRDYRRVVECVFRQQAILPAPPGVVFRSRDVLTQWLELHYFALLDALSFVDDRVEARVDVRRDPDPEVGRPPDTGLEEVLQDALRVLRRHALGMVTLGGDGQVAGVSAASFLVERDRWEAFAALVAAESTRLGEGSLVLSGPWPPYDFVRMQFAS